MELDYKEIGRRIAFKRKNKGLTQRQVCELADIGDKYLSTIEIAKSKPSVEVLSKICQVIDTSVDYVLFGNLDQNDKKDSDELYNLISILSPSDRKLMISFLEFLNEKRNNNG